MLRGLIDNGNDVTSHIVSGEVPNELKTIRGIGFAIF